MIQTGKPQWLNSLGEPVDLDDIDKDYAAAILKMVLGRRERDGYTPEEIETDTLVIKLREIVAAGREPTFFDGLRAIDYNNRNREAGKPFRAPIPQVSA